MRALIGPLVRVLSAVAALTLIATGALIVIEVVAALAGVGPAILAADWVDRARDLEWSDSSLIGWLWVALGVGLLCVLVAVWPRPPATLSTGVDGYRVERRSFERALSRRLAAIDGVSRARVRAGRRSVRARIDTRRQLDPTRMRQTAEDEALELSRRLALDLPAPVVTVRGPRS